MQLIVQKYGGSSVADAEKILSVARRAIRAKGDGNKVVVVVSAMGKTTDHLIELAHKITDKPVPREMDILLSTGELVSSTLLTMALESLGAPAVSLSGAQAGIVTDAKHRRASILKVDTDRIKQELDKGKIVIVAGFQGMAGEGSDITTLGRGGSDTTAVALATALEADSCEIYTDVEGVYTADPRIVSGARKLGTIGYEEMLEMSYYGSKVMHSRAVELGWVHNIPILVACSFNDAPGTIIQGGSLMEARNRVTGIAHDVNVAKITVVGIPDRPGIAAAIFEPLTEASISVDTIVQNSSSQNLADLTFTVARSDLAEAMRLVSPVANKLGARHIVNDASLAKVSIVGPGMVNNPGYASKMFRTLADRGVNILLITTSEIRITCIIAEKQVKDAVNALHQAFELEKGEL